VELKLGKTGVVLLSHSHDTPILIGMRDIFACSKCLSIYEITRLQQKPTLPPRCQVCFDSFPPSELGEWLGYERAEPEWSVAEWLTGQASQFSVASPYQRLAALSQRRVAAADWPPASSRLQMLSSVAGARSFDER
jgi:hypothetical protein